MYYINQSYNNNIVGHGPIQTKEELSAKIDEIRGMEGVSSNAFYVSECSIKEEKDTKIVLDNEGKPALDGDGKMIFEETITETLIEGERIFEIDLINSKLVSKKISAFLSTIQ